MNNLLNKMIMYIMLLIKVKIIYNYESFFIFSMTEIQSYEDNVILLWYKSTS